ncbi:MAG: HEPN domain-containing protein [Nanoarchaeota archaeon]
MNRSDFQKLALIRIQEAKILLKNKCYDGAFYLAGYSVECGLKACIAKKTKKYDFPPNRQTVNDCYIHDLEKLIKTAELNKEFDKEKKKKRFAVFWNVVKDWNEEVRYTVKTKKEAKRDAEALVEAISNEKNGVFQWIKKHW